MAVPAERVSCSARQRSSAWEDSSRPARSAQSSKTCLTSLCSIVFQSDGQRKYVCRRTRRRVGCRGGKCQEEFVGEIGRTGRFVRFVSHRQTLGVLDCSAFTAAFGSSRSSNASRDPPSSDYRTPSLIEDLPSPGAEAVSVILPDGAVAFSTATQRPANTWRSLA